MNNDLIASAVWNAMDPRFQAEVLEAIADPPPAQLFSADPGNGNPAKPWISVDAAGNLYVYGNPVLPATTIPPSGDTSGITDSAAINALVNLGATTVQLQQGNYYTALTPTKAFRLTGAGTEETILHDVGSPVFDFANHSITGMELDHLQIHTTAADMFINVNLHRSYFHHLKWLQDSGSNCIMTLGANGSTAGGANTGLSTTSFEDIEMHVKCDPTSGVRSVPAFYIYDNNGGGKNVDVVSFSRMRCFNDTNNSKLDNTQFIFDFGCQATGAGGLDNRVSFYDCDFGQCLGGGIRCLSIQGILIVRPGNGNPFNQGGVSGWGNSFIFIGQFSGAAVSQAPVIIGYTRESSGTMVFAPHSEIEVDSATTNALIISPDETGISANPGVTINLNGSLGATIINPQTNVSIANPGVDTCVLGGPGLNVYGNPGNGNFGALANFNNTRSNPSNAPIGLTVVNSTDQVFGTRIPTDTASRWTLNAAGRQGWGGGGGGTADCFLDRKSANLMEFSSCDLDVSSAGSGLRVAEGSNAKQGVATLSSGSVVVSNTSVTATSRIHLTAQDNNSTGALRVSARTAGTSFTITSSSGTDSGVVAYEIFEVG